MDVRKEQRLARAGMAASVAAAVGASLCCIGPVAAAMFGVTSLATLVKYEPLRPYLAIITLGFLGAAFYATYRRRPAEQCAAGSVCETRPVNRVMLWIATLIAVAALTFPTWSGTAAASTPHKTATTNFHIEGMTCGSCATAVKLVLKKTPGVVGSTVSYEDKRAVVTYDPAKTTPAKVAEAVASALAYKVNVEGAAA